MKYNKVEQGRWEKVVIWERRENREEQTEEQTEKETAVDKEVGAEEGCGLFIFLGVCVCVCIVWNVIASLSLWDSWEVTPAFPRPELLQLGTLWDEAGPEPAAWDCCCTLSCGVNPSAHSKTAHTHTHMYVYVHTQKKNTRDTSLDLKVTFILFFFLFFF